MPRTKKTSKPTTTRSARSTRAKKTTEVAENRAPETSASTDMKKNRAYMRPLMIIVPAIIIIGLLYYFRGLFVAATVNGQPISRMSVISQLEKTNGKQVLQSQVTEALIMQQAQKKNVKVSDADVAAQMKKISDNLTSQGQTLDSALQSAQMTKDELQKQVKLQLTLEKLVGAAPAVTDKEVEDYIEQNKQMIPEGTDVNSIKGNVKDQLQQQKENDKIQSYVAELQKNAKINYWVNY